MASKTIERSISQNTLPKKPPAYDYFNEPTVYAQIDHFKTMPIQSKMTNSSSNSNMPNAVPAYQSQNTSAQYQQQPSIESGGTLSNSNTLIISSTPSPLSYQNHNQITTTSSKPFSREIVTIRTPLLYTQQESCV